MEATKITVGTTIDANRQKVWNYWNQPEHITQWNFAADEWHCPKAENDLRVGGKLKSRMEAKDGSFGFDFEAVYGEIVDQEKIAYTMTDGRKAVTTFEDVEGKTKITTTFDAESQNPVEMQKDGWQAIINNFKKYVEENPEKMKTLHFETRIDAPVEKVYRTMLESETFKQWTSEFNPTSRYEGSWKKGSKILFLAEGEDGKTSGMVSRIKENRPNEFVSIEHLGMLENGKEITEGEKVEAFAGALEEYTFTPKDGSTTVHVRMDTTPEWEPYFKSTWPKALKTLKDIVE